MKRIHILSAFLPLALASFAAAFGQNFQVAAKGVQSFNMKDERGRNQASFSSKAPLEDISGTADGLSGVVSFDPSNVVKTIKAQLSVTVASMKTGIDMRDEHLRSEGWLNGKAHPSITFTLKQLKNAKTRNKTEVSGVAAGDFTMNGVTKTVELPVTLTYLPESEKTRSRAPGDLLVVRAKGNLKLSWFGVKNDVIGSKVAEDIAFEFNAVGSNAVK